MPVRDRLRPDRPPTHTDDPLVALPGWASWAMASCGAGLASAALVVTLVFVAWLAGAGGTTSGWEATAAGLGAWLFAHGAALTPGGARVSLTPWLLTALPFLLLWGSAGRLVAGLDGQSPRLAGFGGLRRDVGVGGATFVLAYVALAVVLALLARLGGVAVGPVGAVIGPALLALLAYVLALAGRLGLSDLAPRAAWAVGEYVPAWLRAALRPAGWGVVAALACGLLLVIGVVVAGWQRVGTLHAELTPGLVGGVVLVLAQLAYLPTAALWGLSWLAGPGFVLGGDSSLTWLEARPGILPLVPALGALPATGPMPSWAPAVVVVPVLVGVLVGVRSVRTAGRGASWAQRARIAGAAVALATLVLGLAGVGASGSVGAARLSHVGVDPLTFTAALGGELALGAALVVALASLRVTRVTRVKRSAGARPAPGSAGPASEA